MVKIVIKKYHQWNIFLFEIIFEISLKVLSLPSQIKSKMIFFKAKEQSNGLQRSQWLQLCFNIQILL